MEQRDLRALKAAQQLCEHACKTFVLTRESPPRLGSQSAYRDDNGVAAFVASRAAETQNAGASKAPAFCVHRAQFIRIVEMQSDHAWTVADLQIL